MVFGKWTIEDVSLVCDHYGDTTGERWNRLSSSPEWIYHDLHSIFSCWSSIWALSTAELRHRSLEVNNENFTGNVLKRMRRLNRAMATHILLRECLLIQQSFIKEVKALGARQYEGVDEHILQNRFSSHPVPDDEDILQERFMSRRRVQVDVEILQDRFLSRCVQVEKLMVHDLLVVQGILEQLQNLMTMIISIEQISSSKSVAMLGYLGFIFLPLSFAAVSLPPTPIKHDSSNKTKRS